MIILMCIRIRLCFRLRIRLLLCDSFAALLYRFELTFFPQQLLLWGSNLLKRKRIAPTCAWYTESVMGTIPMIRTGYSYDYF